MHWRKYSELLKTITLYIVQCTTHRSAVSSLFGCFLLHNVRFIVRVMPSIVQREKSVVKIVSCLSSSVRGGATKYAYLFVHKGKRHTAQSDAKKRGRK